MEHTASTLVVELKRQIVGRLPPRPLVGGGFHHFELKASVKAAVSAEVSLDAFEALLVDLRRNVRSGMSIFLVVMRT